MSKDVKKKDCKICKHKDHDLGKCKQCNCGQSEIMHSTASRKPNLHQIETWVSMNY